MQRPTHDVRPWRLHAGQRDLRPASRRQPLQHQLRHDGQEQQEEEAEGQVEGAQAEGGGGGGEEAEGVQSRLGAHGEDDICCHI